MHPSIFTDGQWSIIIFWYVVLTSVGGGFLLVSIVKSGYSYMNSALNPGVRASFIEDVQRAVLTMVLIVLAPVFISLLSDINDGFVWLFGQLLNHFADKPEIEETLMDQAVGMFENIIAAPFNSIINMFNKIFGLKSLDELIFNGQTNIFGSSLLSSVDTGNPIANVTINGSMVGFDVYFNAVYTIRRWVITANLVATPIIAWAWAITANRQVLEIWVGEIIQTIFMQTTHALSLGIFMSVATGTGKSLGGVIDTEWFSSGFIQIGVFLAGFAGSICVAVMIIMGIRIITARAEKDRAEAKEGLIKALIGLGILGLCVAIASFLAILLSGSWGVG
ncbi:hypothetical protein SAMN05660649_04828 [Desulfotomaculum arcticum]|uniref:Uncharacterized protein n=1 Tax=Desulfotruncus arcticus DSM 17038 TaxID=1121424 RepID=A0A1I2Z9J7_9FIRM|nr:pilin [Desulfotruncus arcticus]SFH34360.1 hypothetical protein SAMN05660649_04828 [Desulfotomaculum arcticum] [Desulfotruncus arcticus DSM 17038]